MPQTFVLPNQVAIIDGEVEAGAVTRFYKTATNTPQAVYTDSALINAVTSITADASGVFAKVYLNPNADADYRVTLETSAGVVTRIEDGISRLPVSQADVGAALFPRTTAESSIGVTPTRYFYPELDALRYGADRTGVASSQSAFDQAESVAAQYKRTEITTQPGTYLGAEGFAEVPQPITLSWVPFDVLFIKRDGKAVTDWDITENRVAVTKRYYVDYLSGNDASAGTAANTALKTLGAAYGKADYDEVVLLDGVHYINSAAVAPTRSHNLVSFSGNPDACVLQFGDTSTFILDTGDTYVVSGSIGGVTGCVDAKYPDENGYSRTLTLVASAAICRTTIGSWYWDSGTSKLYVHCHDKRVPDEYIRIHRPYELNLAGLLSVYMEGITVEGGGATTAQITLNNTSSSLFVTMYARRCKFLWSANHGIKNNGCDLFMDECEIAWSGLDNGNYNALNGRVSHIIEHNCKHTRAGWGFEGVGPYNNNASSTHEDSEIVRINGDYSYSTGPVIADTGTACKTWCLGTEAHHSLADAADTSVNFLTQGSMYLDTCVSYGSISDTSSNGITGASVNLRDFKSPGVYVTAGSTAGIRKY